MRIPRMQLGLVVGSLLFFGTISPCCPSKEIDDANELRALIETTLAADGADALGRLEQLSSLINRLREVKKDPMTELRAAKAMVRWARRDVRFAKTHRRALETQLKHLEKYPGFGDVSVSLRLAARPVRELPARRVTAAMTRY